MNGSLCLVSCYENRECDANYLYIPFLICGIKNSLMRLLKKVELTL